MSITTTILDGDTKLTWEVKAATDKMNLIFNRAGEYWFTHYFQTYTPERDLILWSSLTNNQKKNILNQFYKYITKEAAGKFLVEGNRNDAIEDANEQAEIDHVINEV